MPVLILAMHIFKHSTYCTWHRSISIINSVLTCQHRQFNSSASVPLNATKIAVMKVSDVEVVRVGPELLFSIYKCYLKF